MGYFYAVMWLIVGLLLIFKISKENKIFYLLGAYFIYMGAWWGVNEYLPEVNLFDGVYGWIFKGISFVILVIIVVFYVKCIYLPEKKKEKKEEE